MLVSRHADGTEFPKLFSFVHLHFNQTFTSGIAFIGAIQSHHVTNGSIVEVVDGMADS